jgi:hypothetical protein
VLLALCLVLVVLTVPLLGGRLGRLSELRIRWISLAVLAVVLQAAALYVVPGGDTDLHRILHLASYVAAGACLLVNLQVPFLWLVALGGLLNFIAIAANGGVMPASRSALETAGLDESGSFANSDVVDDARLGFLGDVFAIPASWPASNVFSLGDVVLVVGVFLTLHAVSGSRLFGRRRAHLLSDEEGAADREDGQQRDGDERLRRGEVRQASA